MKKTKETYVLSDTPNELDLEDKIDAVAFSGWKQVGSFYVLEGRRHAKVERYV